MPPALPPQPARRCSWHTYKLLVLMHVVPDLDCKAGGGIRRLDRYDQLAEYVLGKRKGKLVLLPFQLAVCIGMGLTYNVVGGQSLAAFAAGVSPFGKVMGNWAYFLMFGALQAMLSLVRCLPVQCACLPVPCPIGHWSCPAHLLSCLSPCLSVPFSVCVCN